MICCASPAWTLLVRHFFSSKENQGVLSIAQQFDEIKGIAFGPSEADLSLLATTNP